MYFDESKHPRDKGGRFTDNVGSDYAAEVNERIRRAKDNGIELPLNADGSSDDMTLQKLYKEEKQHAKALSDFIKRVKSGETKAGETFELGEITSRARKDIEQLTGQKSGATKHVIDTDAVRHIELRHGKDGRADSSMSTLSDYENIMKVLHGYQKVDFARRQNGNIEYSHKFKDSNNKPVPHIMYTLKNERTMYPIEAVSDSKKGVLHIVSAYKN